MSLIQFTNLDSALTPTLSFVGTKCRIETETGIEEMIEERSTTPQGEEAGNMTETRTETMDMDDEGADLQVLEDVKDEIEEMVSFIYCELLRRLKVS